MPSAKRSPITYAPAFGGGIFRPKSAVDSDLALLDPEADADQSPDSAPEAPLESVSTVASSQPELPREKQPQKTRRTSKHSDASKLANTRASNPASTLASKVVSEQAHTHAGAAPIGPVTMEMIRRVVKEPGREVTYVRLSPEEKAQLSDVVYAFKRRGQKITETEISRLAVNYILADYNEYGEESLLARLAASLRA